jgi:kinesin family protein C1
VIPSKSGKRSIKCGPDTIETGSYTGCPNKTKKFNFDKVFDQDSRQEEIFEEVQDLIQSSMEGFNVCIMSYG